MRCIYECATCGYQYDERFGDTDNEIESGTEFEDLPQKWVCPVCGAPKSDFELLENPQEYES